MESSRLAGPKRRLALAKKLTAAGAAVAFGLTFVAMRDGRAAASTRSTPSTSTATATPAKSQSQTQTQNDFFGSSDVSPSSGSAPSVSSSTS